MKSRSMAQPYQMPRFWAFANLILTVTPDPTSPSITVTYLVVGGGGGAGGFENGEVYPGGGGGGQVMNSSAPLNDGQSYAVTVGAGGAGSSVNQGTGTQGSSSSIAGVATATGGHGGYPNGNGGTSGSGVYAGAAWGPYQGGGGGGGNGAAGAVSTQLYGGAGGIGSSVSIGGVAAAYYGGGGGGAGQYNSGAGGSGGGGTASAGATNTGGGGGAYLATAYSGGSGIVIISYWSANVVDGSGGTITHNSGYTIHTSTSSGTFVAPMPGLPTTSHTFNYSCAFKYPHPIYVDTYPLSVLQPARPIHAGAPAPDGDLTVASDATYNINTNTQNQSGRSCADGGDAVAYNVTSLGSTEATFNHGTFDGVFEHRR